MRFYAVFFGDCGSVDICQLPVAEPGIRHCRYRFLSNCLDWVDTQGPLDASIAGDWDEMEIRELEAQDRQEPVSGSDF